MNGNIFDLRQPMTVFNLRSFAFISGYFTPSSQFVLTDAYARRRGIFILSGPDFTLTSDDFVGCCP